jgi:hypothetical protein
MVSVDGNDNTTEVVKEAITPPKRNAERTAKVKVAKYGGDDDDDDDDDISIIRGMETDDGNESEFMGSDSDTEKKIKKANTKPRKPKTGILNLIDIGNMRF